MGPGEEWDILPHFVALSFAHGSLLLSLTRGYWRPRHIGSQGSSKKGCFVSDTLVSHSF